MPESAEIKRIGRYDIARILGEGAMGVVYEGNDTRLHRKVAIKRILKSALDSDSAKEYSMRFSREAQAVARLNHPNIVQVFDFAEEGDVAYIVMEFVRGKELKQFFEARERFELKEVVHIMGELCDALNFAHEAGIIHRDIKPANVMIDSQGRVKLTDFGVARIQADSDRTVSDKTQAGTVVGTPAYMSPEQIQGEKLDGRTDIFSAGVILYEFLCGEKPFTGSGAWTIAKKILQDEPRKPSEINNTLSPLFDAVVAKSLAKSAEARYRTAREFGLALKRALEGLPPEIDESERTVKLSAMTKEQLGVAPAPKGEPTMLRTVPLAAQAGAQSADGAPRGNEVELEFWRSIKDGTDPDDFDLYVEQFPSGIYAALARRRSAKLRGVATADSTGTAAGQEQERREIEEAARLEKEARAKLAEEKSALEARLAQREADMAKREAELKETMAKREAELQKQVADAPKRSAVVPVLVTLAVAAIVGGLWYWLKPPDPLAQRVAELTQLLQEAKKREAELVQSRERQVELEKELAAAREREAEALKAGDVGKQRELAEQVKQREAAARQQAELTRQREADARRQAEVAEQRRAEIARLQEAAKKGRPAKAPEPAAPVTPVEPARPAEPVKAAEPVKSAEPVRAAEPVKPAEPARAAEPTRLAAVTPTPTPTPSTAVPPDIAGASVEQMLQRAIALEGEGRNAEAVRLLRQAARSGKGPAVGQAAKRLGDMLQKKGVPGVSYDYAEALKYYQIARDNGVDPGATKGR